MRKLTCALAALLALTFGCGEKSQTTQPPSETKQPATKTQAQKPKEGETKAEIKEGKVIMTESSGEKVVIAPKGGAGIPEGFPQDVPLYKGASIIASYKLSDGFSLIVQTSDERAKAIEACKADVKAKGWSLESTFDTPQMLMLMYKKGKRQLSVGIIKQEGPTRINYQTSAE